MSFPGARSPALRNVHLELGNEKMVVVGANGSGKTTLLKSILGLVAPSAGRVSVFGQDVRSIRGVSGVTTNLPEVYRLISLPVRDLIALYARIKGGRVSELLDRLDEFELTEVLSQRIFQLSTGQQKMLVNLFAVSFGPKLVLLDEPFDNVDFTRRRRFVRLLQELPAGVLLNTHELELLAAFDGWRLALMFEGGLFGPFRVGVLDRLYLSKGAVAGSLTVMQTSLGPFSLTLDRGDRPIKSATSLSSLVEALA